MKEPFRRTGAIAIIAAVALVTAPTLEAGPQSNADWQTLRASQNAYLDGDGGGNTHASVCPSIAALKMFLTNSGSCPHYKIGTAVSITAMSKDTIAYSGLPYQRIPVALIRGNGLKGYISPLCLEPVVPRHTRLTAQKLDATRAISGDPLHPDYQTGNGVEVEVLEQAPYEDGMWVKIRVTRGSRMGFTGWVYPPSLGIVFNGITPE